MTFISGLAGCKAAHFPPDHAVPYIQLARVDLPTELAVGPVKKATKSPNKQSLSICALKRHRQRQWTVRRVFRDSLGVGGLWTRKRK